MRSLLVGLVATLIDLVALYLLVQLLGVAPAIANLPALLLGVAAQFFGNKLLAFRDTSRRWVQQGAQFALVEAGALALNALAFHLLVTLTPVPYPLARLLGSAAVYLGFSFPLWRLIFSVRRLPSGAEAGR